MRGFGPKILFLFNCVMRNLAKIISEARAQMDHNLLQERMYMDYIAKLQHEGNMMQARASIDRKAGQDQSHIPPLTQYLSYSPPDMDRDVQLKRAKMEFMHMPPLADMDHKSQDEHKAMNYEARLDKIRKEAKIMQDSAMIDTKQADQQFHIPSSEQSPSDSSPGLVMEFRVFQDRRLYHVPKGYIDGKPGFMRFMEPDKVEWSEMVASLGHHRYKSDSNVYYINPGCVPPQGMVLISGEEDVEQMMQVHEGKKKCDLYIVRNCQYSDSDDSEMYGGMSDDECQMGYIDCGDRGFDDEPADWASEEPADWASEEKVVGEEKVAGRGLDEDGPSPRTMDSPLNAKKSLKFDNIDEHNSA